MSNIVILIFKGHFFPCVARRKHGKAGQTIRDIFGLSNCELWTLNSPAGPSARSSVNVCSAHAEMVEWASLVCLLGQRQWQELVGQPIESLCGLDFKGGGVVPLETECRGPLKSSWTQGEHWTHCIERSCHIDCTYIERVHQTWLTVDISKCSARNVQGPGHMFGAKVSRMCQLGGGINKAIKSITCPSPSNCVSVYQHQLITYLGEGSCKRLVQIIWQY